MTTIQYRNPLPGGWMAIAMTLAILAFSASGAVAAGRTAMPVDEGANDPSFAQYRAKLLEAVIARDVDGVIAGTSTDVQLSFGGHAGHEDLRGFLTLSEADLADEYKHEAASRREGYWDGLEEVLRMGGRFTRPGVFEAPYTWTVKLGDDDDAFTTRFVIGSDVALRSRPSRFGDVVATLDHTIVTALEGGEGTAFVEVKVPDGVTGFVERSRLRSAVDYRAIFEKRGGKWQLVTFVAGD